MGALRFETFTLDIPGRLLKQGERRLALRRQPFKVLTYLAERPDRLVTNGELIESCWENPRQTSVNSLAQSIKAIREALGETDHEIIRTVHGQGYVFTAEVSTLAAKGGDLAEGSDAVAPPHPEEDASSAPRAAEQRSEPPKPSPLRRWRALAAAIVVVAVLLGGVWEVRSWLGAPGWARHDGGAVDRCPAVRGGRRGEPQG